MQLLVVGALTGAPLLALPVRDFVEEFIRYCLSVFFGAILPNRPSSDIALPGGEIELYRGPRLLLPKLRAHSYVRDWPPASSSVPSKSPLTTLKAWMVLIAKIADQQAVAERAEIGKLASATPQERSGTVHDPGDE